MQQEKYAPLALPYAGCHKTVDLDHAAHVPPAFNFQLKSPPTSFPVIVL